MLEFGRWRCRNINKYLNLRSFLPSLTKLINFNGHLFSKWHPFKPTAMPSAAPFTIYYIWNFCLYVWDESRQTIVTIDRIWKSKSILYCVDKLLFILLWKLFGIPICWMSTYEWCFLYILFPVYIVKCVI